MNAWRAKAATGIRTESGLMIAHLVLYQDILIELKAEDNREPSLFPVCSR